MPDERDRSWPSPPAPTGELAERAHATRIRALARLMDSAVRVPGTNVRLGLDAVLGLLPGAGDLAAAAASVYIVSTAARLGVPRSVLVRMFVNVGADVAIGSIPILGDLFDVAWRANTRNAALLDAHLESPTAPRASSGVVRGLVLLGVLVLAVGSVLLSLLVFRGILALFA